MNSVGSGYLDIHGGQPGFHGEEPRDIMVGHHWDLPDYVMKDQVFKAIILMDTGIRKMMGVIEMNQITETIVMVITMVTETKTMQAVGFM